MLDASALDWAEIDRIPLSPQSEGGRPPVWLALDEVQDPVSVVPSCVQGHTCSSVLCNHSVDVVFEPEEDAPIWFHGELLIAPGLRGVVCLPLLCMPACVPVLPSSCCPDTR